MALFEMLKSVLLGVVEGITEWLPISSTGHMILVNSFLNNYPPSFTASDLYLYVIQLGAILAVVTMFFKKLNPLSPSKTPEEKKDTRRMWFKVLVACIPAAVIGLLLDPVMERFETPSVVAATLIIYGILFIVVERLHKKPAVTDFKEMTYKTALFIGLFQVLSIIPGTSRSGATILGAMLLGCSRSIAAEFSFFLAIPVMVGVSVLKIATNLDLLTAGNIAVLLVGMVVAYIVSMLSIKFLMKFVQSHDFKSFGWYRIVLGVIVLVYFHLVL